MAEHERGADVGFVNLELEEADAVVQLSCYVEGLVGGYVALDGEGGVVGANVCDVAEFAVAELGVAVAGLGVCGTGGG